MEGDLAMYLTIERCQELYAQGIAVEINDGIEVTIVDEKLKFELTGGF